MSSQFPAAWLPWEQRRPGAPLGERPVTQHKSREGAACWAVQPDSSFSCREDEVAPHFGLLPGLLQPTGVGGPGFYPAPGAARSQNLGAKQQSAGGAVALAQLATWILGILCWSAQILIHTSGVLVASVILQ